MGRGRTKLGKGMVSGQAIAGPLSPQVKTKLGKGIVLVRSEQGHLARGQDYKVKDSRSS